jgi:oligoribonuclease
MKNLPSAYVWFDTEYTSLDLESASLLQVAAFATDTQLNRLSPPEEDINFCVKLEPGTVLSPWIQKNLPKLVEKCRSEEALGLEEIDAKLSAYLDKFTGTPQTMIQKRPMMAGNSVHNDWFLARRFLPSFISRLHYRLQDVSSMKVEWILRGGDELDKDNPQLLKKYYPQADVSQLRAHDAYFDIVASAAELGFYRQKLFAHNWLRH